MKNALHSLPITVLVPLFASGKCTRKILCKFTKSLPIVSNKPPTNLLTIQSDQVYGLSTEGAAYETY